MFEFLIRRKKFIDNSDKKEGLLYDSEDEITDNTRNQEVESFKKKIQYHGESLKKYSQKLLSSLAREKEISQGVFYIADIKEDNNILEFLSGYAYRIPEVGEVIFKFGESLPGQVAKDGKLINIADIPEEYITIESGLGKASPVSLIIFPIKNEANVIAVIELASFHEFTHEDELFFEEISPFIAGQILKCTSKS